MKTKQVRIYAGISVASAAVFGTALGAMAIADAQSVPAGPEGEDGAIAVGNDVDLPIITATPTPTATPTTAPTATTSSSGATGGETATATPTPTVTPTPTATATPRVLIRPRVRSRAS